MNMNQLNDNKAGMEGLDKAKINEVIRQSTGARYQSYLDRKHARLQAQIDRQMQSVNALTREQKILNEQKLQHQCAELEHERDLTRTHVHIDMDAFYAAVEMRDTPALRHVPMAVGGMQMLSTSNYLARAFGVRAAMPGFVARRLCPQLVIVPTNFHKYTDISRKIKQIMLDYDQGLSMGSLDEAYLDISDYLYVRNGKNVTLKQRQYSGDCICWLPRLNQKDAEQDTASTTAESKCSKCHKTCVVHTNEMNFGDTADEVVREIRFRIEQRTGLTASAGIAPNSMLAKIASDKNKPNGQCRVENTIEAVNEFMMNLPVRKVSGVGSVLESQLKALDVHVCGDIQKRLAVLPAAFSDITIDSLMRISTGVGWSTQTHDDDETSVNHRKSVSVERTFTNESDPNELLNICEQLCESLAEDVKEKQLVGYTVTVKLKTINFDTRTRAQTVTEPAHTASQLYRVAQRLLLNEINAQNDSTTPLTLRLLGVRLSSLNDVAKAKQSGKSGDITKYMQKSNTNTDIGSSTDGIISDLTLPDEKADMASTSTAMGDCLQPKASKSDIVSAYEIPHATKPSCHISTASTECPSAQTDRASAQADNCETSATTSTGMTYLFECPVGV